MSDIPAYDRIMWRGKTLAAMSEDELRAALRDCWLERKALARADRDQSANADIRRRMGNVADTLDKIFNGSKP